MKIDTLSTLLEEELKDIYDAEKRLVKAIPKLAKAASSQELRNALKEHLEVTKGQVERLEQVFELLGITPKSKPCTGMKGLIEEGDEVLGQDATDILRDAAIIGAAQRVEHYEMAVYGTARAMAERLGQMEVVQLLQHTLDEEKKADETLSTIAEQLLEAMENEEEPQARSTGKKPRTQTSKA